MISMHERESFMDEPVKRKVISLSKSDNVYETEELKEKDEFKPRTAAPVYKDQPFVPDEIYPNNNDDQTNYITPAYTYMDHPRISDAERMNIQSPYNTHGKIQNYTDNDMSVVIAERDIRTMNLKIFVPVISGIFLGIIFLFSQLFSSFIGVLLTCLSVYALSEYYDKQKKVSENIIVMKDRDTLVMDNGDIVRVSDIIMVSSGVDNNNSGISGSGTLKVVTRYNSIYKYEYVKDCKAAENKIKLLIDDLKKMTGNKY